MASKILPEIAALLPEIAPAELGLANLGLSQPRHEANSYEESLYQGGLLGVLRHYNKKKNEEETKNSQKKYDQLIEEIKRRSQNEEAKRTDKVGNEEQIAHRLPMGPRHREEYNQILEEQKQELVAKLKEKRKPLRISHLIDEPTKSAKRTDEVGKVGNEEDIQNNDEIEINEVDNIEEEEFSGQNSDEEPLIQIARNIEPNSQELIRLIENSNREDLLLLQSGLLGMYQWLTKKQFAQNDEIKNPLNGNADILVAGRNWTDQEIKKAQDFEDSAKDLPRQCRRYIYYTKQNKLKSIVICQEGFGVYQEQ